MLASTASNSLGKVIALATWFFLTPFLLGQLGPEQYGLWVLVGSTVAYGALLDLGIAGAVTKYVAEHRARGETEQARALIATSLRLYSGLGLAALVLSALLAPLFPALFNVPPAERTTASWLVLLMGATVGLSLPGVTGLAVLQGLQRYDLASLLGTIGTLLSAGATVAVLLLGGGLLGMVAVNLPIAAGMQAANVWCIRRVAPELGFGWRGARRGLVGTILSFSTSLFVTDLATYLETRTDEVVVGAFLPLSAVTPYAVARKLSEVAALLTAQFMKVLLPLASELQAAADHDRLRTVYLTGTRLALAIFAPIGCSVAVLAGPILSAWVGPAYADSAHLVVILTLAGLISTSQWPGIFILQGMARQRRLAALTAASAFGNLALSVILAPRLGLTGVALGTLIPTTLAYLGLIMPYAMRSIGVGPLTCLRQIYLPALGPALPAVGMLVLARQMVEPSSLLMLAPVAAVGVLTYLVVYLAFGASAAERAACRRTLERLVKHRPAPPADSSGNL